jgi:DNA-binding MarR family transcriptional regulator/GNAT superfamily N-acetyltransferase
MMANESIARRADRVRQFTRFYTRQAGVLHEHLLDSEFSLTQARILYELAHGQGLTAADLGRELGLDAGYLSRVLAGFQKRGFIEKKRSPTDGRSVCITLTRKGNTAFRPLDQASHRVAVAMLERLPVVQQQQLIGAMEQIEGTFSEASPSYVLRNPQAGDMGWVIHRHGALYAQEYGWNTDFEALVAQIVAGYMQKPDSPERHGWIAEKDGKVVGSVFVVRHTRRVAKLRLLYVEPSARGLGIGNRLVDECLRFAKQAGYSKMVLWTNSILTGARHIYRKAGFTLVHEEPHHSFGKDLVGETWERAL